MLPEAKVDNSDNGNDARWFHLEKRHFCLLEQPRQMGKHYSTLEDYSDRSSHIAMCPDLTALR
ncbi:hypothetical protein Nmel_001700 [Mimus melanotis]